MRSGFNTTVMIAALSLALPLAARAAAFRGVVGVQKSDAEIGGEMVVRVREFDAWIIYQMRTKMILGEKYFDASQFYRWLNLLQNQIWETGSIENAHFGKWTHDHLDHGNPGDPDADLFQAYDALRRDIWDGLYLVLGNSRLKHVRPRQPHDQPSGYGPDGVTFYDLVFVLEKNTDDAAEWEKIELAQYRVPLSVRVGFDLGGAQFTLDTIVPEDLQPPGTKLLPDTDALSPASKESVPKFPREFSLITYSAWDMAAGFGLLLLALGVFIALATTTAMLRDPDLPRRTSDGAKQNLQFNLARCQTAFWFFLIAAGYLFLGPIKGWNGTITDQCLVLLGISTGTTLASAFISKTARTAPPPSPAVVLAASRRSRVQRFLWEILSDDAGKITFYRFQMVVWTLVLGSVFVTTVYMNLEMPKFGANELALMGISAGTYLGFKFPEVKATG